MDAIIPPIDKLGNFPIVQFAVAIMVVAFGAAMMWRAFTKSGNNPPASPAPAQQQIPEQRWYFEGPIAEAFKQLALIVQNLQRQIERVDALIKIAEAQHEVAEKTNKNLEEIERTLRDMPSASRRR